MATRQRPPVDAGRRHASRSRGFLSAGFSLLVLVALLPSPAGAVKEVAFADIDPAKPDQVVLMHRSGEDASASALAALKDAESRVKASGVAGTERLEFIACDAAGGDSGDGMERKGLVSLPALFVAVKDQGRDRYLRELSGEKLSEYIQGKFQVSAEDDVFPFDRDLISDEYPVLVKFHERWCTRCEAFRKAFETAASHTVGHVMFMEVECSSGPDALKFCDEHAIDGFPTVVLTGGKIPASMKFGWSSKGVEFDRDRSVQGLLEFLETHVPETMAEVAAEKAEKAVA